MARAREGQFYSLPQLEKEGVGPVSRLPVSIRIVLESVLRNCDGQKITEDDVRALANWQAKRRTHRRNSVRRRARAAAGLHRRAAAGRSGGDAIGGRAAEQEPGADRAARAGRSGDRSLGAGRFCQHQRRVSEEHGDGVQTQQLALPVSEVGHAGVRRLSA